MGHDPRHRGFAGKAAPGEAPLAATADILRCYEEAVQEPRVECTNLDALYTNAQPDDSDRQDAIVLREDFCSTAIIANTWLSLRAENRSQGVDIDLDALRDTQRRLGADRVQLLQSPAYASASHSVELHADERKSGEQPRMVLLHSDVLDLPVPALDGAGSALEPPDLVASLNYAMAYFHDRATLVRYLRGVVKTLRPHTGVFITDMFGGPPTGEEYPEQEPLWERFRQEPGFVRQASDIDQVVLDGDRRRPGPRSERDDLQVLPAPSQADRGTRAEWPRGKLKMVRTGAEHGGFEYWREDGPVDYMTNRFRMSLSFRFRDGSWLRDVFSYDFRIWSLRELMDAMEEAGFFSVRVLVLPRNDLDSARGEESESDSDSSLDDDFAQLFVRTEKQERQRRTFHVVEPGEKVFTTRSFATYMVARAP